MKWRGRRSSSNVEDRRGQGMSRGAKVGGGMGVMGIVAAVVIFLLGGDPSALLGQLLGGGGSVSSAPARAPTSEQAQVEGEFASVMLAETEDTWNRVFQQYGQRYREPTLVLYEDQVRSACGMNSSATGPFYCPGDYKLYLDTSFFNQLARMGGAGDFASAYVIAHEVGHHVQNLTGVLQKVRAYQSRVGKADQNALQVLVELQADCYAGVWGHHANAKGDLLERGDIEEGLRAAAAIGDDTLQQNAGRRARPETFTHGTSAQRKEWLMIGLRGGDVSACDTFAQAGVSL
ncbi:MAG: neutral zinc metallopeptidase [Pseudomonadota bacterium]